MSKTNRKAMKMDRKAKKKWLKALRSGRYKQGQQFLLQNGKSCCLGVLCATQRLKPRSAGAGTGVMLFGKSGSDCYLPRDLQEKLGIADSVQNDLIDMNDTKKKTFKEIADWIEECL